MNRGLLACSVCVLGAVAAGVVAACSSSSNKGLPGNDSGVTDTGGEAQAPFSPVLACTDSIASVYADPGDVSAMAKGAIIKCAHDQDISAADLLAAATSAGDAGTPPYSGHRSRAAPASTGCSTAPSAATRTTRPATRAPLSSCPTPPRATELPSSSPRTEAAGRRPSAPRRSITPRRTTWPSDYIHQSTRSSASATPSSRRTSPGTRTSARPDNPPSAYADTLTSARARSTARARSRSSSSRASRSRSSSSATRRADTPRWRRSPSPTATAPRHHRRGRRLRAAVALAAHWAAVFRAEHLRLRRELGGPREHLVPLHARELLDGQDSGPSSSSRRSSRSFRLRQ